MREEDRKKDLASSLCWHSLPTNMHLHAFPLPTLPSLPTTFPSYYNAFSRRRLLPWRRRGQDLEPNLYHASNKTREEEWPPIPPLEGGGQNGMQGQGRSLSASPYLSHGDIYLSSLPPAHAHCYHHLHSTRTPCLHTCLPHTPPHLTTPTLLGLQNTMPFFTCRLHTTLPACLQLPHTHTPHSIATKTLGGAVWQWAWAGQGQGQDSLNSGTVGGGGTGSRNRISGTGGTDRV